MRGHSRSSEYRSTLWYGHMEHDGVVRVQARWDREAPLGRQIADAGANADAEPRHGSTDADGAEASPDRQVLCGGLWQAREVIGH